MSSSKRDTLSRFKDCASVKLNGLGVTDKAGASYIQAYTISIDMIRDWSRE